MTTKSKNKIASKKTSAPMTPHEAQTRFRASTLTTADRRKELLARVAGSIAAGLVTAPSPSLESPSAMATVAVDIAEAILKRAGISSGDEDEDEAEGAS